MTADVPGMPLAVFIAFIRDDLALDFANTRQWRGRAEPLETLESSGSLLAWMRDALLLPEPAVRMVTARWRENPATAEADILAARELRETIYRIFNEVAQGRQPVAADMTALNQALGSYPVRRELAWGDGRYGWTLRLPTPVMPGLLAPVVWAASDLLVRPLLARVHRCANEECLWLFVDDSKSGNRRWCSMSSCGNRAKAQRHYIRRKEATGAAR